jgi:hypothetical protein
MHTHATGDEGLDIDQAIVLAYFLRLYFTCHSAPSSAAPHCLLPHFHALTCCIISQDAREKDSFIQTLLDFMRENEIPRETENEVYRIEAFWSSCERHVNANDCMWENFLTAIFDRLFAGPSLTLIR